MHNMYAIYNLDDTALLKSYTVQISVTLFYDHLACQIRLRSTEYWRYVNFITIKFIYFFILREF